MKHIVGLFWGFILIAGCGLLAAFPPLGIALIIVAILGAGSMTRRQKRRDDERRHQEMLEVMRESQNAQE